MSDIAAQANPTFSNDQGIRLAPHVLRHTMLRKVAEEYGVQYAMEFSGHTSSRSIWRYIKLARQEIEEEVEGLFLGLRLHSEGSLFAVP